MTEKKRTLADWKKAKRHSVTLPSGFEVEVEIPNLPQMVKTGQIPNNLIDAALGAVKQQEITRELIEEQSEFFNLLVATMVKEPAITVEELQNDEVPYEDVELLVEIGTRQRDLDALGRHISGLHTSEEWRKFRGWDYGD